MIVGLLEFQIRLHGANSLKDKRKIVKSVIGKLTSRFNVSAAEVDKQDSRAEAVIGLAIVSNESNFINQQLDKVINFIRADGRFYLGQIKREIFPYAANQI